MGKTKSASEQLASLKHRLQVVLDSGRLAMWDADLATGEMLWSAGGDQLLGREAGWSPSRFTELLDAIHPEDRADIDQSLVEVLTNSREHWTGPVRVVRANGAVRNLAVHTNVLYGRDSDNPRMIGMALDVTDLVQHQHELEHSEQVRDLALSAADMGIFTQDLRTGKVTWTDRQYDFFGVPLNQFDGTTATAMVHVHPEDYGRAKKEMVDAIARRAPKFLSEFRVCHPNGAVKWIACIGELVYSKSGEPLQLIGVNLDITSRKQQEEALRESEGFRRLAMSAAKMGAWRWDFATGVLKWSEEQEILFGLQPGKFDQRIETFWRRIHPDDLARVQQYTESAIRSKERKYEIEFRIVPQPGIERWVGAVGEIEYDGDRAVRMFGVNFDVTERVRSAQAIAESERLRRIALRAAQMGAWEFNPDAGIVRWSPEQYRLFGVDPMTFVPTFESTQALIHPEDRERAGLNALKAMESDRRYYDEFRVKRPDGSVRWIANSGEFDFEDGRIIRVYGVSWDITDKKNTEERLRRLNQELKDKVADFESLLRAIPAGVAISLDPNAEDIRYNQVLAEMVGIEDRDQNVSKTAPSSPHLPFTFLRNGVEVPPEDLPQQVVARTGKEIRDVELELLRADGQRFDLFGNTVPLLDGNGELRGSVAVFLDITGRKRSEQALRTSEKLATAGRMAASLAHEINNPLAAITNLLYLISQERSLSTDCRHFVSMATTEIARVSQITRNMLAFYRDTHAPVQVDLCELVESVLELYQPKISQGEVKLELRKGERCMVKAFPGELRQVISNLVLNAVEAMPNGGLLRIRIHRSRESWMNRGGVRIVVTDSGVGIPKHSIARLFEPFFTTKGEKGTGLGLWVCRDIIGKHDGSIRVRSSTQPGKSGTCFSVFLPADSAFAKAIAKSESSVA